VFPFPNHSRPAPDQRSNLKFASQVKVQSLGLDRAGMNQKAEASGSKPEDSKDSILAAELAKLESHRSTIKEDNQRYLESHPELTTLLDGFISAVIQQRPSDIVKFGSHYFNSLKSPGAIAGPSPLVIAGPSGVGKGTLIKNLLDNFPEYFGFSVSHTTRLPRPGEVDGQHYHFVTKGEFEGMVKRNEFIEHANVHTAMYGTSKDAVTKVRVSGKICILDIDIQGVRNVKQSNLDCKYLFIAPPSLEALKERLQGRGTEDEEKMKVRLENAPAELEYGNTPGNFDANVVNNELDEAYSEIISYLNKWYVDLALGIRPK
jgi:guanylate kinase